MLIIGPKFAFQYCQNQPRYHILLHINGSLRDFYKMTLITDKRTDVWSQDFIISMKNQFRVVGCGLWSGQDCEIKKVWADYEQLLRPVFSLFWGQKKF